MANKLVEGVDYYWEEIDGVKYRVFTGSYLLKRGFCCKNGCKNCPYNKGSKKE
jgi:hypothetical protein